jgi:hypothetical protein
MLQFIRRALEWLTTPKPTLYFEDAILGQLTKTPDMDSWTAKVELVGKKIEFGIAGDDCPNPPNLEHAREIAQNYSSFELKMKEFIDAEIAKHEEEDVKEVLRQLRIESILLFWEKRPTCGMIYFHEVNPYFVWRCDYVDGKFQSLGADT